MRTKLSDGEDFCPSARRALHARGALLAVALCAIAAGASGCGRDTSSAGYSVTFDSLTVEPGKESTKCVVKRLGNPRAMHVGQVTSTLGPGSHHVIIYKSGDTTEQPTPFDCKPFSDLLNPKKGVPLMIAQHSEDSLKLPAGVGIPIEAMQMVRLEMHYINASPSSISVTTTATFSEMPEGELKDEAGFAFFSNSAIDIPPQSTQSLGPLFVPIPDELAGVKFFGFTGHQHQFGTGVKVSSSQTKDGPGATVYDPPGFVWSEPPTVYPDPPVVLPPGGGFRLTCNWQNPTTGRLTFGESANDEMCVFWSYYYPSKGFVSCAYTDKISGGYTFCCPGDKICSMLP